MRCWGAVLLVAGVGEGGRDGGGGNVLLLLVVVEVMVLVQ